MSPTPGSTIRRAARDYAVALGCLSLTCIAVWSSYGTAAGVLTSLLLTTGLGLVVRRRTADLDEVLDELVLQNTDLCAELEDRRFADERQRERISELEERRARTEEEVERREGLTRSKNEFLARVGHEVRTPMTGIVGMLEVLATTELDGEQREYLQSIQDSVESLLRTLDVVLDVSRIESGDFEIEEEEFDMHRCLEGVLKPLYLEARERGIELTCLIDPGITARLRGSEPRLRQLLRNLIGNAIRRSEQGSVHFEVGQLNRTPHSVRLEFVIRAAIDLSEDELSQPYDAADGDEVGPAASGLGPAVSRRLAAQMGGSLDVVVDGDGATARFSPQFRLVEEEAEDELDDLSGLRVLVAEESAGTRRVLASYLRAWSADVEEVEESDTILRSLHEAVEEERPFDVLILGSDSLLDVPRELAEQIRGGATTRGVRLLLVYTAEGEDHPALLSRSGFDAWISKPVGPARLRRALGYVLLSPEVDGSGGEPAEKAEVQEPAPRRLDVLLVEDNLVNQRVGALLLKRCGCRVSVAGNGQEAIGIVEKSEFDLIFMDCHMPVMDGYEATRAIRSRADRRAGTPIVALTANAAPDARNSCLAAGMDDYLAKPVTLHQIQHTLERWGRDRAEATSDPKPPERPKMNHGQEPEALDRSILDSLRELGGEDDPGLLAELIQLFLDDTPARMQSLLQALESGDAKALERAAHALKSSAANLGALGLSAIYQDLEAAGRNGDLERATSLIGRTSQEFERVRHALKDQIG